ncbi:phage GP46 family protein [Pyruvatibacter sp.]
MSDIAVTWDGAAFAADWRLLAGDLATDADLESAIIVSLFTDARAGDDDVLPDSPGTAATASGGASALPDRRGWWGNTDAGVIHDTGEIGSKLWLLAREKRTDETLNRARQYCREALAWLIDDGVASRVEIDAEYQGDASHVLLALDISVIRSDGTVKPYRYAMPWSQLAG